MLVKSDSKLPFHIKKNMFTSQHSQPAKHEIKLIKSVRPNKIQYCGIHTEEKINAGFNYNAHGGIRIYAHF